MRPAPFPLLTPAPREVLPGTGHLELRRGGTYRLEIADGSPPHAARRIEQALIELGLEAASGPDVSLRVRLRAGRAAGLAAQAYTLVVDADGVDLEGTGAAGLLHGAATLAQLLRLTLDDRRLRCATLRDAPTFERRGWMLDVSRDRIPTLESLLRLVDLLADLKGNELQLYTEHTFAYARHEEVWRAASPLTPDDIKRLDAYCAQRGIELVPNQNCLGHFHHWLRHDAYRDLAEVPEGVEHPFSREKEPFSLCPTDPRSLAFITELLDELLPCFRSREVNVGLDETFDLGQGRSRVACEREGVGRVYLRFLTDLNAAVVARDHRMQFWADVLLEHPELVPEVPKDAIAMLWGYEADHPFDSEARAVAASGLTFTVCPGTSSWQSLGGRTDNMIANITGAVRAGHRHGARGVLVTDWGDRGHLQPEWASAAGWILASALSWNDSPPPESDARDPEHLARLLDAHVFRDGASCLGRVALELGRAGEVTGARAPNASVLSLFLTAFDQPFPPEQVQGLTERGLERSLDHIETSLAQLATNRCARADASLLLAEMTWVARLQEAACQLGLARLRSGGPLEKIPAGERSRLAQTFHLLATDHRRLWLRRCRPGGLELSAEWLERLARALRTD